MKKIILGMLFCLATSTLLASVDELVEKLGECKEGMDKLVQALGDIGKVPDEGGDGGTGAPPFEAPPLTEETAEEKKARIAEEKAERERKKAEETGEEGSKPKKTTTPPGKTSMSGMGGVSMDELKGALAKKPKATPGATVTPPPGTPKPKFAAPKKEAKDFIGKVDFFIVPHYLDKDKTNKNPYSFEASYQAFFSKYLMPKYRESEVHKLVEAGRLVRWATEAPRDPMGRAYFEKAIVGYSRQYIDKFDAGRGESKSNPLWVYNSHLKDVMQWLIESKDPATGVGMPTKEGLANVNEILTQTAEQVVRTLEVFFAAPYEKAPTAPSCSCLLVPLEHGYDNDRRHTEAEFIDEKDRIPRDHPLYTPAHCLIYATMQLILHHGFYFTNRLIPLFDLIQMVNVDVVIKDKEEFRAGFDEIFDKVIESMIGDEKILTQNLLMGIRLDAQGREVSIQGKPNRVIYGKREKSDTIYWCEYDNELFPDNVRRLYTRGYAGKDEATGQYRVINDELIYALLFYIKQYSSYSVGLIPYYMPHVLKLKPEKKAAALEEIGKAIVNVEEQKRILKKAQGLMLPIWVAEYIAKELKKKTIIKLAETNAREVTGVINTIHTISVIKKVDDKNVEVKPNFEVAKITAEEWIQIFQKLKDDPVYTTKIQPFFAPAVLDKFAGKLPTAVVVMIKAATS